jgi:hypothetical protein
MKVKMNCSMLMYLLPLPLFWISCSQQSGKSSATSDLEMRTDSLEQRIAVLEKPVLPGLAILMNRMQIHHSRLWEPGVRQNRKLSGYEFSRLKVSLSAINRFYGGRIYGNAELRVELAPLSCALDCLDNAINTKS